MLEGKNAIKKDMCSGLKSLDLFGEKVQFTFQGRKNFNTWIGSSISCLMITFFISFLVSRTIKLAGRGDPFFSMTVLPSDTEAVDLWNNDFYFAIPNIRWGIGWVQAHLVSWEFKGKSW